MATHEGSRLTSVLSVPTALWAYGFLRSVSFGLPILSDSGTVGLGAAIVFMLFVGVVRRATWAWILLALLDAVSLTITLVLAKIPDDVPWGVASVTLLALVVLVTPSVQRHVGWPQERRQQ